MDYLSLLIERSQRFWELAEERPDLAPFFACHSCALLAYAALAKRGIAAPAVDSLAYYVETLSKVLDSAPEELLDPRVVELSSACDSSYLVGPEEARALVELAKGLRERLLDLV